MLVRIERSGVDVDVRVELLNGNVVPSCLEEFANRRGDNAFAQLRNHSTRYENILSLCHNDYNLFVYKRNMYIMIASMAQGLRWSLFPKLQMYDKKTICTRIKETL